MQQIFRVLAGGWAAGMPLLIDCTAQAAVARQPAAVPVCQRASHERLIVREGRDVCGATLNREGRPIAMGLLPTECANAADEYRIDVAGNEDRCVRRGAGNGGGR